MKIVLFGAPGSGKGTQANFINAEFNIPKISVGDILRKNISEETELGKKAEMLINKGQLMPDEIVIDLVKERISKPDCKNGYILDGFPRTYEQAVRLNKISKIDAVLFIDVTMNEVERRALNRRICSICGKIFNLSNKYVSTCECGGKLIQREDDKIEIIRKRMEVYLTQSKSIIDYYKKKKILFRVLSEETPEKTYLHTKNIILSLKKNKKTNKRKK